MRNVIAVIFAVLCISTATLSNSLMGIGLWFWVIMLSGIFVGISQFSLPIQKLGVLIAIFLSFISGCAALLGLVASTIGGSGENTFNLDPDEALLLFLFFMIMVTGIILVYVDNKARR